MFDFKVVLCKASHCPDVHQFLTLLALIQFQIKIIHSIYLKTYADSLVFYLLECLFLGEGHVVMVWFYLLLFLFISVIFFQVKISKKIFQAKCLSILPVGSSENTLKKAITETILISLYFNIYFF